MYNFSGIEKYLSISRFNIGFKVLYKRAGFVL